MFIFVSYLFYYRYYEINLTFFRGLFFDKNIMIFIHIQIDRIYYIQEQIHSKLIGQSETNKDHTRRENKNIIQDGKTKTLHKMGKQKQCTRR
jgi:hypothetical protein